MTTFQIASALNALAIIAALTATPSQAQPDDSGGSVQRGRDSFRQIHRNGPSDGREI